METFVPAGQLYGPILPAFIMNRAISLGAKIAYAFLPVVIIDQDIIKTGKGNHG